MPLELLALPAGTAIAIVATKAQRRRLYGLLRSTGDVRALVLDCNRQLREWKMHSLSRTPASGAMSFAAVRRLSSCP